MMINGTEESKTKLGKFRFEKKNSTGHGGAGLSSQTDRRRRQEDHKFKPTRGNLARPCSNTKFVKWAGHETRW